MSTVDQEHLPSDEELVARQFEIADPLTLDRFLPRVRPGEDATMEYFYRKGSGGSKVPCAYCKSPEAPNHRKGFVMRYRDGSRVLIGKDCGAEHFGQRQFQKMVDQLKASSDRRSLLLRRGAALAALPAFRASLRLVLAGANCSAYLEARQQFAKALPSIHAAVAYAVAAQDGQLTRTVSVRDLAAESEREERREAEALKRGKPYVPSRERLYRDEEQPLGKVRDGHFYRDPDPVSALRSLLGRLQTLEAQLPSLSSNGDLTRALRELRDHIRAVSAALDQVDRLHDALSPDNMTLFVDWATYRGLPGSYRLGLTGVFHDMEGREPSSFKVPPVIAPVDRSFIAEFEAALAVG